MTKDTLLKDIHNFLLRVECNKKYEAELRTLLQRLEDII